MITEKLALVHLCEKHGICSVGTKDALKSRLILKFVDENQNIIKGKFSPKKYYTGLTKKEVEERKKEIATGEKTKSSDRSAYKPFKTDKNKTTKTSSYTTRFHQLFPGVSGLSAISKATGIPGDIIKKVYDKGLAAWRTGHRPGATQGQWGYARVYSFVLKGCTYYYPDNKLADEAKERSEKARSHWKKMRCMCKKGCSHKE
jgi:hypothetical protein